MLDWHLPVLIVMTALSAYFIHTGRLRRWHGFVLLALYVAYWVVSFTVFGEAPVESGLTADHSVVVGGRVTPPAGRAEQALDHPRFAGPGVDQDPPRNAADRIPQQQRHATTSSTGR